jgi:hypothetical protein
MAGFASLLIVLFIVSVLEDCQCGIAGHVHCSEGQEKLASLDVLPYTSRSWL